MLTLLLGMIMSNSFIFLSENKRSTTKWEDGFVCFVEL